MSGFIVINRKITDWQWWHNPTARGFWLYLLIEANWKDGYLSDGTLVPRGSLARSLRKMAFESELTVKSVRYWLKKFENSGEIVIDRSHPYTFITIVNYCKYQDLEKDKVTPSNTVGITPSITPSNTPSITVGITDRTKKQGNKETNIDVGIKNTPRPQFKTPSVAEIKDYVDEHYYLVDPDEFYNFYSSKGWMVGKNHMKDWKAAVRRWHTSENRRRNENSKKNERLF